MLYLVGGAITILKNDGVRQWEGWHSIYEMEKMFGTTNQMVKYHAKSCYVLNHEWSTSHYYMSPANVMETKNVKVDDLSSLNGGFFA